MTKRFARKPKENGFKKVTPETYKDMPSKTRKYYPTVSFDLADIPEAKDWKVGEMYTIHIIAEMRSISKRKDYDDKEKSEVSFEIHEVDGGEAYTSKKRYPRTK